jgi:hypothetical protein
MSATQSSDFNPVCLDHPALESVRPYADRLRAFDAWPSVLELDRILRDRLMIEPGVALEAQTKKKRRRGPLDRDSLYVVRIHDAGRIPTRECSWHDLLNALVWAAFPESKRALTARQRAITEVRVPVTAHSIPGARTREEDALAMLDEGGIVIVAEDPVHTTEALRSQAPLSSWGHVAIHVFGHALMEHAALGNAGVRGYGVVLGAEDSEDSDVISADRSLARWITDGRELAIPELWRGVSLETILELMR